MRHYVGALFRLALCVSALLVWHRVRMGIPVSEVIQNPQLIFGTIGSTFGQGS